MSLSIENAMSRAKAHEKKREIEQARQVYADILKEFPNNTRARKALETLGGGNTGRHGIDLPQEDARKLITFMQQGKPAMALKAAEAIAIKYPASAFLWDISGMANASLARFADAEGCFRKVVEIKPDFADAHNNLGNTLKEQGKLEDAAESYIRAIALNPGLFQAHSNLGAVLLEQGKPEEAADSCMRALAIKPDYAEAHNNHGNVLKEQGKLNEAAESYRQALRLKRGYAQALNNLGTVLQKQQKRDEAMECYNKALNINPNFAETHNNIGLLFVDEMRNDAAEKRFRHAIKLNPNYAEAYNNLGSSYLQRGELELARKCFIEATDNKYNYVDAINNIGTFFHIHGNFDEAMKYYDKSINIDPNNVTTLIKIGNLMRTAGKNDEAIFYYEKANLVNPEQSESFYMLSTLKKYDNDNATLKKMIELSASESLSLKDQSLIDFALAAIFDNQGDFETAFEYYKNANSCRKAALNYDISCDLDLFSRIRSSVELYGAASSLSADDLSKAKHVPIFILGMPRSGTTLVEQILSSHSDVHGGGELNDLALATHGAQIEFPDDVSAMRHAVRTRYMAGLESLGADERFVTDKTPHNFLEIGYIMTALPDAKVVHLKRDPRAVCWSNYRHHFGSNGIGYAYDLEDVANYYILYSELMDFWRERFPGRIYDLDYESLTENQENETRRLLDHLGLEWQDACLEFHRNRRLVRTISTVQVRRKIYTGSSEEWRRYEPHLKPMLKILEDADLI